MRRLVVVLLLLATACGAFTDDPYRDTDFNWVAVGPDGRTLDVGISSCDDYQFDVEETADEVRLDARARDDGGDCGGARTMAHLDAPLGDRPVIDANSDEVVEVTDCGLPRNRNAGHCNELLA